MKKNFCAFTTIFILGITLINALEVESFYYTPVRGEAQEVVCREKMNILDFYLTNNINLQTLSEDLFNLNQEVVFFQKSEDEEIDNFLYEQLKNHYAYFYKKIGGSEKNSLIASKIPLENLRYTIFGTDNNNNGFIDFIIKETKIHVFYFKETEKINESNIETLLTLIREDFLQDPSQTLYKPIIFKNPSEDLKKSFNFLYKTLFSDFNESLQPINIILKEPNKNQQKSLKKTCVLIEKVQNVGKTKTSIGISLERDSEGNTHAKGRITTKKETDKGNLSLEASGGITTDKNGNTTASGKTEISIEF